MSWYLKGDHWREVHSRQQERQVRRPRGTVELGAFLQMKASVARRTWAILEVSCPPYLAFV